MKIKRDKLMNLGELISYGIEQGWESHQAVSEKGVDVYFSSDGKLMLWEGSIDLDDVFVLEGVVEEITRDTPLFEPYVVEIEDGELRTDIYLNHRTINELTDRETDKYQVLHIYLKTKDGGLQRVWSKDAGIPKDGMAEIYYENDID